MLGRYEKLNKVAFSGGGVLHPMAANLSSKDAKHQQAKDNKDSQHSVVEEDAAKRAMLANFLVDLHLSAIQRAEEKSKHVLETRLKFASFLRRFKTDIDTQLTKKKIEKTGDRDLEISFASAHGEHEKVIAYFLDESATLKL